MQYDFETKVDRTGMASIREITTPKEVEEAGLISFWGAEFEFKMPDFIIKAIKDWAVKGLVSYFKEDDAYFALVKKWMKMHRSWDIEKSWIVPTYGLTFSVGTICRAFTNPGDGVIGMSPVYHMTWKPVSLNGRKHVDCPLLYDGESYHIDFIKLGQLMKKPQNKILFICNPHNPIAKVWRREDLAKIADLAWENDVIIYSDEIFADTVYEGVEMLTFSQVTDKPVKWIVATSIGKTFSMTGIGQANIIISEPELREKFLKQRDIDHYGSFNPMMRAAYFSGYTEEGSRWVKEMMKYCYENYQTVDSYCKAKMPYLKAVKPEGTYILWVDCRKLGFHTEEEFQEFFQEAKFVCDSGTTYGSEPGFIRINLAAPRAEVIKALKLLKEAAHRNRESENKRRSL